MTDKELNQYIDELLQLFIENDIVRHEQLKNFGLIKKDLTKKAFTTYVLTRMQRLGMIDVTGDAENIECTLTAFGLRVIRHGNWTKYLYNKEDLINKQIKTSIKLSWAQGLFSLIITIATVVIGVATWNQYKDNESNKSIKELKKTQRQEKKQNSNKLKNISADSSSTNQQTKPTK